MAILFFAFVGFSVTNPPTNSCVEILRHLFIEHRLEVANAQSVGNTIVYLLTDKSGHKTAQVGCVLAN